jgi:phosphohistidine phosphatase
LNLYIVRHGDANALGGEFRSDHERTLSDEGRSDAHLMAQALVNIDLNISAILTSPLVRAIETGEIFGRALKREPTVTRKLEPGFDPRSLTDEVLSMTDSGGVVVIGHQPDMSMLISYLISPTHAATVAMETCAIAAVHLPSNGPPRLRWLLTPEIVRRLNPSF